MTRNEEIVAAGLIDAAIGAGDRLLDEVDWLTRHYQAGELPPLIAEQVDDLLRPHLRHMAKEEVTQ